MDLQFQFNLAKALVMVYWVISQLKKEKFIRIYILKWYAFQENFSFYRLEPRCIIWSRALSDAEKDVIKK